jgi:hypothetical protein
MILGRSIASTALGTVPLPGVDDWLAARIARGTIARIAESHGVDASPEAVRAIADGQVGPPQWAELAGGGLAYKLASRGWRRVLFAYFIARRARAAAHTFTVATLFDHYCARLHVGLGLDAGRGADLRADIDRAIAGTPGGVSRKLLERAAVSAARASLRAPVRAADAVSRGAVTRLLERRAGAALPAEEIDTALERELRARSGLISRAAAAVELQFAAEENPYLDRLLDTFEELWRSHPGRSREP